VSAVQDGTVRFPREPLDIQLLRGFLRRWPFYRGRGVLLRAWAPRLRRPDLVFEVAPGLVVPAEVDDYMVHWCFVGDHERDPAFQLSHALLAQGDVVLDIGANVGLWALGAALRVGGSGVVHGFEPLPANFARLERNLALNQIGNVLCRPLALAEKPGRTTFFAPTEGNSGAGSLAPHAGAEQPVEVAVTTLDLYCAEQGISQVDFIKIDVEGGELVVFCGGQELLGQDHAPAIMLEVDEQFTADFGSSPIEVKRFLVDLGYEIYCVAGKHLRRVEVAERHRHADLFAFKPCHRRRYAHLVR
jgi:FkbM family methyltransferase